MEADGELGLVRAGRAVASCVPVPTSSVPRLAALAPELREVDSVRCEVAVLPGCPDADVTFRDDAGATAALVEKGAADAAVLLRPVTVDADPRRRFRRGAHAAEDDVLPAQAPHRLHVPQPGRIAQGRRGEASAAAEPEAGGGASDRGPGIPARSERRPKGQPTSQVAPEAISVGQVARAALLARRDELALHLGVVHRALDVAEDADRRGNGRVVGQPRQRERQRRMIAVLVVHEQPVLAHVGDVDDLGVAVRVQRDAAARCRLRSGWARRGAAR